MLSTGPAPLVLIQSHGGWTEQERTSHKFSSGPSVYPPDGPSGRAQGQGTHTGFGDRDISTLTQRSRTLTPHPHRGT